MGTTWRIRLSDPCLAMILSVATIAVAVAFPVVRHLNKEDTSDYSKQSSLRLSIGA